MMPQVSIIQIFVGLISVGLFFYLRTRVGAIASNVKEHLFTPHGVIISMLWGTLLCGFLCMWMFFSVRVMGYTTEISTPDYEGMNQAIGEALDLPKKGKR
jgi:polyferredoxin